jgi:hypothetical protein
MQQALGSFDGLAIDTKVSAGYARHVDQKNFTLGSDEPG